MTERGRMGSESGPGPGPRDERLRSLLKAAYPAAELSEVLERRMAELVELQASRPARPAARWMRWSPRWTAIAGALTAALLLGLLCLRWDRHRRDRSDRPTVVSKPAPPLTAPKRQPFWEPWPRDRGPSVAEHHADPPGRMRRVGIPVPEVGSGHQGPRAGVDRLHGRQGVHPQHPGASSTVAVADDLIYVNDHPEQVDQQWATLPQDEWERIEAQVRHDVRVQDDFVQIPFPRLAAATGRPVVAAIEGYKREAAVVDSRLFRKVTLELKGVSLDDLCAALQAQTGVELRAARGVGDDKVTVFLRERPAREVMRAIVRLFGYVWARSKKVNRYQYELIQDLRSQLTEEELRNRDTSAALLALDHEMQAYHPYLGLSSDQLRVRYGQATGDERERLRQLVQAGGWVGIQLYNRLTPAERTMLLGGQPLLFSPEAALPDRRLPAEWVQPILRSLSAPPPEKSVPLAEMPGITLSSVSVELDRSELGRVVLAVKVNAARASEGWSVSTWARLADGRGTAMAKPDNTTANEAMRTEAPFQQLVSVRPECSCSRLHGEKLKPGETPVPFVFSADVWEALYRVTGQSIVADFYTRLYPIAGVTVERKPLFDALCQIGEALGVRWRKEGDTLLCRSASFFWDRLQEVPNRYLQRWQQEKRERGGFPLESLIEMASLSDDQLNSNPWGGRAIMDCWGLNEWQIVGSVRAVLRRRDAPGGISPYPPHLELRSYSEQSPWLQMYHLYPGDLRTEARFLGTLTPDQRRRALQVDGLAVAGLSLDQQRRLLQLWDQEQAKYEQQGHRLDVKPQQLLAGRFSVEYIPAGWYYWSPPWTQPEPRPRVLPHLSGRSAGEALAAARRIYPDASPDQIKLSEDGDLMPSISVGPVPLQGGSQ